VTGSSAAMATVNALSAATLVGSACAEGRGREDMDSAAGVCERVEAGVGCRLSEGGRGAGVLDGCLSGPWEDGPGALRRMGALGFKPAPPFFLSILWDVVALVGYNFVCASRSCGRGCQLLGFKSCGGVQAGCVRCPLPAGRRTQIRYSTTEKKDN
jgi:hypothetical protein